MKPFLWFSFFSSSKQTPFQERLARQVRPVGDKRTHAEARRSWKSRPDTVQFETHRYIFAFVSDRRNVTISREGCHATEKEGGRNGGVKVHHRYRLIRGSENRSWV